ncbi:hypothetical protein [Frankia sp. Cr1]|uniref:hypothetical protein n=1 Tax=Frankia sp. Cr1 TaxID=3073931 RepID=UPI002AD1FB8F|nr:hypothetical protein [Frankia sp. Cr1]
MAAFVDANRQTILVSCDSYTGPALSRHLDVGIREMTAVSTAAGLAAMGCRPIVLGLNTFLLTRALGQLRQDVVHNRLPVIVVGKASGGLLRAMGPSHFLPDDLLLLRSLQPMDVLCPTSPAGLFACLGDALARTTPTYLRVGQLTDTSAAAETGPVRVTKPVATLVTAGDGVAAADAAKSRLRDVGVEVNLAVVGQLMPFDATALNSQDSIIIVFECDLIGLGDLIARCTERPIAIFTWLSTEGPGNPVAALTIFVLQALSRRRGQEPR